MFNELQKYLVKPELYAPGTRVCLGTACRDGAAMNSQTHSTKFWDDEHISRGMLEAHLDPDWDAATRKHEFVDKSVKWISEIAPPSGYNLLLDLGCGPGLYAERFSNAGYSVTGVDLSKRSIEYAKEQTLLNESGIEYRCQDYLTLDYADQFDVITLIYCDYAVLSDTNRQLLVRIIHRALKPGGKFIFDVFTPCKRNAESHTWGYFANGGFWCEKPHICLESVYQYDDADRTELSQSIVLTEEALHVYNIWDHYFTKEALLSEIQPIGFNACDFYGDVAGKEYSDSGEAICGVFTK